MSDDGLRWCDTHDCYHGFSGPCSLTAPSTPAPQGDITHPDDAKGSCLCGECIQSIVHWLVADGHPLAAMTVERLYYVELARERESRKQAEADAFNAGIEAAAEEVYEHDTLGRDSQFLSDIVHSVRKLAKPTPQEPAEPTTEANQETSHG